MIPGHSTVAAPEDVPGGAARATVVVTEERIRHVRLVVTISGRDEAAAAAVRMVLARRWHRKGRVTILADGRWSLPATRRYAAALYAVLAAEEWIRVEWEAEVRAHD